VLREHIQEILRMVNHDDGGETATATSPGSIDVNASPISQLMDAAPEQRHAVFMRIYFDQLLPHVIKTCVHTIHRRDTPMFGRGGVSSPPGSPSTDGTQPRPRANRNLSMELLTVQVTEIWCTLVFRMLCWLLLHDFHKNDRQVSSKSEVWGSRLPVYIG